MTDKRIILFGGTFDPVHLGHTTVASAAADYITADKIIFIPAKRSPLKGTLPRASDIDRLNMLSLAIKNRKYFEVSDYELNKPAPSYTLDTVKHFKSIYGNDFSFYWLVGADSINDLIYWYGITELIDICNLSMMYRAEYNKPDFSIYEHTWGKERVKKLQDNIIPTPLVNISSTQIRSRISTGQNVSQLLDNTVLSYITEHGLYKSDTNPNNL